MSFIAIHAISQEAQKSNSYHYVKLTSQRLINTSDDLVPLVVKMKTCDKR